MAGHGLEIENSKNISFRNLKCEFGLLSKILSGIPLTNGGVRPTASSPETHDNYMQLIIKVYLRLSDSTLVDFCQFAASFLSVRPNLPSIYQSKRHL